MHTLLVARTVRGLEPLVAEEVGHTVRRRHREVWFERQSPDPGVLELRTADDVLLPAAVAGGVGRAKTALDRLRALAAGVDAAAMVELKTAFGGSPLVKGVDVSASFLGRRAYNRYDMEDAVGGALAARLGVPYHSRRHGPPPPGTLSWRVSVEGDEAAIGLRIADRPLHRRPYKTRTVPGTLHPPVAAAMARLAGLEGARTVLDPCCGAGTTLIEARAYAPVVRCLGVDLSPSAVAAAVGNAGGGGIGWAVADAGRLPLPSGSVDRVLVNPPWERQVASGGSFGGFWRELRRVLAERGRVVALLPGPADPPGFEVRDAIAVSLMGRHAVIAVLSLAASRGRGR
ncbi:methyltransferase domain-containing protein [Nonomuraea recticatena]|uniref:Ribosomal RNA large subunit methyltransferase K/L-like methyltransferase domain-containing protein n=1 Tax=Nonomuraea recticatena TaxID=46178 RepID=A0ABP6E6P1_9ACTN